MAQNLYLDANTNDLVIEDNQLRLVKTTTEQVSQDIQNTLLWYKNEWYLDVENGFPWFQNVFKKGFDARNIRSLLVQFITKVKGVSKILSLELDFQVGNRHLQVDFTVLASDNTEVKGTLVV